MWGAALSLVSSAIPAISKAITGGKQKKEAERLRKDYPRPTFETPRSQKEQMEIARQMATTGVQGKSKIEDQLRSSTSNAVRTAEELSQDPASKLAAITSVYGKEQEGLQSLEISDSEQRLENLKALQNALKGQSEYDIKEFEYNKDEPYRNAMAAASALTGASMQNKQGALEDVGRLGVSLGSALGGGGGAEAGQEQARRADAMGNFGEAPTSSSPDMFSEISAMKAGGLSDEAIAEALGMTAEQVRALTKKSLSTGMINAMGNVKLPTRL